MLQLQLQLSFSTTALLAVYGQRVCLPYFVLCAPRHSASVYSCIPLFALVKTKDYL